MKLLVTAGADTDVKNNDGQRAKDLCRNHLALEYLQPPSEEVDDDEDEEKTKKDKYADVEDDDD